MRQNDGKMTNLAERKTCVQYSCQNLGFPENNVLAEFGNKALEHTFDVLNPKVFVTTLGFEF